MAVCSSSLTIGTFAQPRTAGPTVTPSPTPYIPIVTPSPNPITSKYYVRINGNITKWGATNVIGTLQTQAKIATFQNLNTKQLASATAIWTTNISRPISAVQTKENFTYTFYEATLRNASVSTLSASTSAYNYFLNGTWNVYTVKFNVTIYVSGNGQITGIHRTSDTSIIQKYGAVNVTDNWTTFKLAISGIAPLTGSVVRSVTNQVQFNLFKVIDQPTTNVVSRADVAAVAQAYGSMPGWGNYNPSLDVCGHFQIDICDLSTVAANVGSTS